MNIITLLILLGMSIPIVCLDIDEYLNDLFYYRYDLAAHNEGGIADQLFLSFVKSIEYIKEQKQTQKNELLYDLLTEIYSVMDDELMSLPQFKLLQSIL